MAHFLNRFLHHLAKCFLFLVFLGISSYAHASNECAPDQNAPNQKECREVGEWSFDLAIGLGYRSNPLFDGDDIPLVLLPSFSYYGENFFIDNLDFGYTLFENQSSMLNLLVTPSYDRVFFERWDINNILVDISVSTPTPPDFGNPVSGGDESAFTEIISSELNERKFSALAGIEYSTALNGGELQFNLLKDITDVHSGSEIRMAYAYAFSGGVNATFGLTWKDKSMTDYYYGVDQNEVVDDRGYYEPGASLNPFFRLSWQQENTNDSFWRFVFEYQQLDSEIADSPIVDKDHLLTIFVGKQINF